MGPFDRFNDRAKRVLALAQDETIRFNHKQIGPEHLLLGLVREGEGVAARVFNTLGVDLGKVRAAVEAKFGRGGAEADRTEIRLSPELKQVIDNANDEAKRLSHGAVGTEHLLLGLVREGSVMPLLATLGLEAEQIRGAVIAALGQPPPRPTVAETRPIGGRPSHLGWRPPYESYDENLKRVLELARDEAIRLDHNYIGTEHQLAGLIRGQGLGPQALHNLGVDLAKVRTALEFIIGRGDSKIGIDDLTISPRAKVVLEFAVDEAKRLGRPLAGTEHLLLGLLDEGQGIASGILESLGVTLDRARTEVIDLLQKSGTPPPAGYTTPPYAKSGGGGAPYRVSGGPFDRFSDRGKRVLALAQQEAIGMGHDYIGTEHILLGLLRLADHGDEKVLRIVKDLGLQYEALRGAIVRMVPMKAAKVEASQITLTPRTKKVIEIAIDEARAKLAPHVEPEHFLLALVRESEGIAGQVLESFGATGQRIRAAVDAAG